MISNHWKWTDIFHTFVRINKHFTLSLLIPIDSDPDGISWLWFGPLHKLLKGAIQCWEIWTRSGLIAISSAPSDTSNKNVVHENASLRVTVADYFNIIQNIEPEVKWYVLSENRRIPVFTKSRDNMKKRNEITIKPLISVGIIYGNVFFFFFTLQWRQLKPYMSNSRVLHAQSHRSPRRAMQKRSSRDSFTPAFRSGVQDKPGSKTQISCDE